MTTEQEFAITCALADLCGAYQAHEQRDTWLHDWDAHRQSIADMAKVFNMEIPEDCK